MISIVTTEVLLIPLWFVYKWKKMLHLHYRLLKIMVKTSFLIISGPSEFQFWTPGKVLPSAFISSSLMNIDAGVFSIEVCVITQIGQQYKKILVTIFMLWSFCFPILLQRVANTNISFRLIPASFPRHRIGFWVCWMWQCMWWLNRRYKLTAK